MRGVGQINSLGSQMLGAQAASMFMIGSQARRAFGVL